MCRRHLRDIAFTSVPSVTPCAYYIRLLVYHSIFRKNHKNDSASTSVLEAYILQNKVVEILDGLGG